MNNKRLKHVIVVIILGIIAAFMVFLDNLDNKRIEWYESTLNEIEDTIDYSVTTYDIYSEYLDKPFSATLDVEISYPETYNISAYCPCTKCNGNFPGITATGKKLKTGMVAMDKSIPFGTKIYVDGLGIYTNEDVGGAIKGNKVDIYFNTHEEALEFGRQYKKIWILSSEDSE